MGVVVLLQPTKSGTKKESASLADTGLIRKYAVENVEINMAHICGKVK